MFGYGFSDMSDDQMQYPTFEVEGRTTGGIGAMGDQFPAEVPGHWNTYFAVADTDAAVAKATGLGAGVSRCRCRGDGRCRWPGWCRRPT